MARVRTLLAADADIEQALLYTFREFGIRKYDDYAALIQEALADEPRAGRNRRDIDPEAWVYHISKRGRRARHLLLYRILDDELVEVLAVLHDAMNLRKHWRARTGASDDET